MKIAREIRDVTMFLQGKVDGGPLRGGDWGFGPGRCVLANHFTLTDFLEHPFPEGR